MNTDMKLNDIQKRFLLFLGGCIPTRLFLVWLARTLPPVYLQYMGFVTLIAAFGFIYIYLTGKRIKGEETFGAPIWWGPFRIIHGLLYLIFSIYAIQQYKDAYLFLLVDVLLGLSLFLWHHYTANNFSKLF